MIFECVCEFIRGFDSEIVFDESKFEYALVLADCLRDGRHRGKIKRDFNQAEFGQFFQ